MKKLNKRQSWDSEEKDEMNKEFNYLIHKIIIPVIENLKK